MPWKWHKAECPECRQETPYYWLQWKFYVRLRGDGIPCDANRSYNMQLRGEWCEGRLFPPEPEKFE